MEFNNLLLDVSGGVALLKVNRPKALNALNADTLNELDQAFVALTADREVRVIIVTGTGEKAFVAGADIAAMVDKTAMEARDLARLAQGVLNRIERCPKPVIAAVNGYALGGGCELAMACDIRLAADTARLGQPEINLGIIPGWAGTQRLARLVGKGKAKQLILTGDMVDADEACRIGLVEQVVPAAELVEASRLLATKLASKGEVALRLAKDAIDNGLEMESLKGGEYEAELFGLCFSTTDQKEGMLAFLEKRKAQFKGE